MTVSLPGSGYPSGRRVTAVLGPTNTGKTHLAVERMLAHESGMIGLPLRLLAREVYDRIVALRGSEAVALVTGEEKIVPTEPLYYVCTVEAMPSDHDVDFLAIDEVQLAADPDRGHVFTDRLLHRRGTSETMLLGAATIKPLIEQLLPGSNFISRPRFSNLTYAGQKKITRLPRRTAVVAFSADSVYAIAELIRRQRGGAAVVMGALSPRTRNAQVELYQSGDVDFLVATDAVGMGLNMDVDHVAFAATRKFDGRQFRELNAGELGQIAGRAGRHMNDGTFGVTADAKPFEPDMVERIEEHRFEALKVLQWRNRNLDFSSLDALRNSLNLSPSTGSMVRARSADDVLALERLANDNDIRDMAGGEKSIGLLWEVCQVPDYRNITGGDHAALVGTLYRHLMTGNRSVPEDWFEGQLSYADRVDGDIDTLATRIAHVRTWSFIANRADWLENPAGWRERTREIEDRLSDALHERLTQRFIDRRTSILMKRLREKEDLMAAVSGQGEILVEGEYIGRLTGFNFVADSHDEGIHGRALRAASLKVIADEISARANQLSQAADEAFDLDPQGLITWNGEPVARVKAGDTALKPGISLIADEQLSEQPRQAVQERLDKWLTDRISDRLAPLVSLSDSEDITGLARGIAFRLVENLGVLVRDDIADDLRQLDQDARGKLRKHGVRFGAFHVFVPVLLKPAPAQLRLLLWALQREREETLKLEDLPAPPPDGLTSVSFDKTTPRGFYQAVGYRVSGSRAVRIDMLERLGDLIRDRVYWKSSKEGDQRPEGSVPGGGFTVVPDMMSLVGCSGEDFAGILRGLGFRMDRRPVPAQPTPPETQTETADEEKAGDDKTPGDLTDTAPGDSVSGAKDTREPASDDKVLTSVEDGTAAPVEKEPAPTSDPVAPIAAESTPPADVSASDTEAVTDSEAAADEPQFIEVWRPRRQAPRQARRPRAEKPGEDNRVKKSRAAGGKEQDNRGPRKNGGKNPNKHQGKRTDRPRSGKPRGDRNGYGASPPRREPKVDLENSPFAALGALKKAMEDGAADD